MGFGRPKSFIFALFGKFFSIKIDIKLKLKKKRKIAPLAGGRPLPWEPDPFVRNPMIGVWPHFIGK